MPPRVSPWVPYPEIPDLTLIPRDFFGGGVPPVPFAFKPFGTLVATGTYLGSWIALRQGRRLGFQDRALTSFLVWVGVSGFVLGHVLDTVAYYPERVLADPLSLVRLWEGLSSYGGFVGALVGGLLWGLRYKTPILPYADVVGSSFPVGWVLGRAGCYTAHDHPGRLSDAWIAVQYPGGARLDLGFIEMLLTIPLALAFLYLRRKPRPWGYYLSIMCTAYPPVRFALDFLRAEDVQSADVRYLGLTPAQYACFGLFGIGLFTLVRMRRTLGTSPSAPVTPEELRLKPAA